MHKAYKRTVGTVILKIESVGDKLQSQHVELLYDNKHNNTQPLPPPIFPSLGAMEE